MLERLGGSPEALRDVSVSLDNVGRVAQTLGNWSEAESVYRESLAISRQLLERLGGSPEALEDLAVSLVSEREAATLLDEASHLYERLIATQPAVERYRSELEAVRQALAEFSVAAPPEVVKTLE